MRCSPGCLRGRVRGEGPPARLRRARVRAFTRLQRAKTKAFTRFRRASHFLLCGQEKVTKEKATPTSAPAGLLSVRCPAVLADSRPANNSHVPVLRQFAFPRLPAALLGAAARGPLRAKRARPARRITSTSVKHEQGAGVRRSRVKAPNFIPACQNGLQASFVTSHRGSAAFATRAFTARPRTA